MALPATPSGETPPSSLWPSETGPDWPPVLPGPPAPPLMRAPPGPPASRGPTALPDGGAPVIPARAAWWGLGGFAGGIILAGIGASLGEAITGSKDTGLLAVFGDPGLWAGMFVSAFLVSRHFGSGRLGRDYGLRAQPVDLAWGAAAFVAVFIAADAVVNLFAHSRFAGSNTQVLLQQQGNRVNYVAVALVVAVGAPFFEELFFRGFLRTALTARLGPHGAVFGQAALFGLAHLGEVNGDANVSLVLAMFAVGVVLGYSAKLTGRLAPGMVAHCLFNLVAVISLA